MRGGYREINTTVGERESSAIPSSSSWRGRKISQRGSLFTLGCNQFKGRVGWLATPSIVTTKLHDVEERRRSEAMRRRRVQ